MNPKFAVIVLLASAAVMLVAGLSFFGSPQVPPPAPATTSSGGSTARESADAVLPAREADAESFAKPAIEPAPPPVSLRIAGAGNLLAGLASISDGPGRDAFLDGVVGRLAALGPEAALAQVQQLPDAELRDMAMLALLQEWSGVSTLELIRRGDIWRFGASGALGLYLLDEGRITADQAAAMARASSDANRRAELLARVGVRLAGDNPAAAMALADGLDERQRQRFAERLAANLAEQSPDAARRFALQLDDPGTRSAMLARILETEAAEDPAAAARGFMAMPPDEAEAQARAARRIGSEWASRDTLSALQWVGSLDDERSRNAARQGIDAVAPVGIGARLAPGEGGLPVLQELVPGSPASTSGQLRAGDTLLAVSDANGRWVDARSVQMGDLIGLIRGEANTQVSLQIQSAGGGAPRTVTIGRQQIIHSPR